MVLIAYAPYGPGALLKFHFPEGWGVADCRPWASKGDLTLEKQIAALQSGKLTRLTTHARTFAELDAKARAGGKHLLEGLEIPASHALLNELPFTLPKGFSHFKVKVNNNDPALANRLHALFHDTSYKLRLDICHDQSEGFDTFLDALKGVEIDFIEDPPHPPKRAIPIANDWKKNPYADLEIFKPAIHGLSPSPQKRSVVTCYLGHPIEQIVAAYVAAQLPSHFGPHGLLGHLIYPENPFSSYLPKMGTPWYFNEGTGWGFDKELETLSWISVS